jgi:CBS-domain-containing membrane protein
MSRRSGIATFTLSLAVAVALSGCSAIGSVTPPAAAASTTANADLFTAPAIDQAIQALAKKVGASPMKVLDFGVYSNYIDVEAADPAKPTEVNKFIYMNGTVQDPEPVELTGFAGADPTAALKDNLFDSTEIKPEVIAKLLAESAAATKIEGAKAETAELKRNLPWSNDLQILVNVQGTRASKQVRATADGTITEIV